MRFPLYLVATALMTTFVAADPVDPPNGGRALDPAAFEAMTTGKTFIYATEGGIAYGAEEYLPGRKVRWSFLDGECKSGEWYVDLDLICFVYEDNPVPQCWSFSIVGSQLRAQYENTEDGNSLYSVDQSEDGLECLGPLVGV